MQIVIKKYDIIKISINIVRDYRIIIYDLWFSNIKEKKNK